MPVKLKIVLLGSSNVGKTSIIDRFVKGKFREFYEVWFAVLSLPSLLIFSTITSGSIGRLIVFKYGIRLARNDSNLWLPLTWGMQTVLLLLLTWLLTLEVRLQLRLWRNFWRMSGRGGWSCWTRSVVKPISQWQLEIKLIRAREQFLGRWLRRRRGRWGCSMWRYRLGTDKTSMSFFGRLFNILNKCFLSLNLKTIAVGQRSVVKNNWY